MSKVVISHGGVPVQGPVGRAPAIVLFVMVGHPGIVVLERRAGDLEVAVPPFEPAERLPVQELVLRIDIVPGRKEPQLAGNERAADGQVELHVGLRKGPVVVPRLEEQPAAAQAVRLRGRGPRGPQLTIAGQRSVEHVRTGLGDDVDGRSREVAVFRLAPQGDDADLLDVVVIDVDHGPPGGAAGVGRVDAVHQEDVFLGGAAVGRGAPHDVLADVEHARRGQGQVIERVAAGRELVQHLPADLGVDGRRLDVDHRGRARHCHGLLDGPHRQGQVDRLRISRRYDDVLLDDGLEVGHRGRELVGPARQLEERVRSPGRGDHGAFPHQGRARDLHGRPWERLSLVVGDRSRDLPVLDGLGPDDRDQE